MSEAVRIVARKPEAKRENLVSGRQKTASHFGNSPADRILLLQKTIGNQAVQRLIESGDLQAKLKIGSPGDIYEQEADRVAEQVMQMPERQVSKETWISGHIRNLQRKCSGCINGTKSRKEEEIKVIQAKVASGSTPESVNESHINATSSGGQPLPESVRAFYEPRFGADFSQVRVHTGSQAAETAKSINAKAFTVGQNIAFGGGQYAPGSHEGRKLLAHELTHTIQQGDGVQRDLIQRDEKESSWWDELTSFGETTGWTLLRKFAPLVVPIVEKGPEGVFDWLKERAGTAAEGIFTSLMTPVRAISGVGQQLSAQFAPLLASVKEAGAKIARNDCSPIREAAEKIENTAERLITPIVEKLQPVVAKVKDFLNGLWDKLGAPIWDLIQQYASAQWAQIKFIAGQIQAAANWIWNKTASLRSLADKAWTWLKNKLGIGEGAEGQDGILQWVQRKLDTAWTWLKAKLEPFKKELTTIGLAVGGVALALSPAGPVLAIGAAVAGAAKGLHWIYTNWGKGNIIVQSRVFIEKTLIPPLQGAANRLGAAITRTTGSISAALNNFAAGMARAVGSVGGSLLGFAVSAVQWIADQVTSLADWAQQQLGQLSQWMTGALDKLQIFLHQMLDFFAKVGNVVLDIWGLPVLLGEKVWNWVPSCIRDPIVDFLAPIILRQIEIFQELVKDDGAWQKTKAEVSKIIRLVFKDHDLMGAVRATFYLILRVFNLPPNLLVTVAQKALSAWDMVVKKPLAFIKNTVRALGHGFRLLWAEIGTHLAFGVQGWLLGEIKEKNIKPPEKWTDPAGVFFFVLDVLGLSVDHIYELLKKRGFNDQKVDAVRKRIGQVGRALDWINKTIDTTKSPKENVKGMIGQAKDFGTSILTGIVEWIAGKVAGELAMMAAAAAASAGLSEVIDIARRIYKAILTAVRWARRILDMANEALDNVIAIASGAIEGVGVKFKEIMHNGMPVIIGFLADQVGLGGVGQALRNIIDKLRAQVDKAILWLIDKIKAGIEALIGAVKAGVAAVLKWWGETIFFQDKKGRSHRLFFVGEGDRARLKVASSEMFTEDFIAKIEAVMAKDDMARALGGMSLAICKQEQGKYQTAKDRLAKIKPDSPDRVYPEKEIARAQTNMAASMRILIDLLPENQLATIHVKPGDFVSIPYKNTSRKGEILIVSNLRIRYKIEAIKGVLEINTTEFLARWGKDIFEYVEGSLRDEYLGNTPGKASATGKQVITRYRQMTVKGELHINLRSGLLPGTSPPAGTNWGIDQTHPLLDCDMSHHPKDAVDFWNNDGRKTGPKSQFVRDWMMDPKNYILEPSSTNRARGSSNNSRYKPPTV